MSFLDKSGVAELDQLIDELEAANILDDEGDRTWRVKSRIAEELIRKAYRLGQGSTIPPYLVEDII
jgi:hypothetical protein